MAPTETDHLPEDAVDSGFLFDADGGGITAADLYDPQTGQILLIGGAPVDPPPPPPGGVRMGLIDSGVLPDHPQLRGLIVAMEDFTGQNDPVDRNGHGTLVALRLVEPFLDPSGAVARPVQPSPSKAIVSAKVTDAQGRIAQDHVIAAIHWMATQNVRVVNMSLGFMGRKEKYQGLCEAITQYSGQPNGGIQFVVAAGNYGPNVIVYPAGCGASNVIRVGGVIDDKLWAQSGKGDILAEAQVKVMPPHRYYYEAAIQAYRAGDLSTARDRFHESLNAMESVQALFDLAMLDIQAEHYDDAFNGLLRAQTLVPGDAMIELQLGTVRLLQSRPADALPFLDRAVEGQPDNVSALTNRAIALMRTGEPGKAMADLLKAHPLATDRTKIDALIQELFQTSGRTLPGGAQIIGGTG
jgi:subtilisin family serine protease